MGDVNYGTGNRQAAEMRVDLPEHQAGAWMPSSSVHIVSSSELYLNLAQTLHSLGYKAQHSDARKALQPQARIQAVSS